MMRKLSRRLRETDELLKSLLGHQGRRLARDAAARWPRSPAEGPERLVHAALGHGVPALERLGDHHRPQGPGDRHLPGHRPHAGRQPALGQPPPRQDLPPGQQVLLRRGDRHHEQPPSSTAGAWTPACPPRSVPGDEAALRRGRPPLRGPCRIPLDLDAPLRTVPGVGPARARAFADAGLRHGPRPDLPSPLPLRGPARGDPARGRGGTPAPPPPSAGGSPGCAASAPGGGASPWCAASSRTPPDACRWSGSTGPTWRARQDGGEYLLHGPVREAKDGLELLNPSCERAEEVVHGARVAPVYPAAGKRGAGGPAADPGGAPGGLGSLPAGAGDGGRRSCSTATACRRWARPSRRFTIRRWTRTSRRSTSAGARPTGG